MTDETLVTKVDKLLAYDFGDESDYCIDVAVTLGEAKRRITSLEERERVLASDWFDKAIRDHCDEHGPSGGAWNISMILERLHSARTALSSGGKK